MCEWLIRELALDVLNAKFLALSTLNKKITSMGCLKFQKNLTWATMCFYWGKCTTTIDIFFFSNFLLLNVLSLLIIFFLLSSLTHHSMSLLFFSSLCLSTESLGIALSTNFLSQIPSRKLNCFIDLFALSPLCPHLIIEGVSKWKSI